MFKKLLDNTEPQSLANKLRRKRFKLFEDFIKDIPRPVKILDAGGTVNFWEQTGFTGNEEFEITIVNLEILENTLYNNIILIKGNVTDLSMIKNKSFDAVFSNSVIEHIPTSADRQQFAAEVQRVGKKYFIQTPNYYFPFEPHFLFPCFQYLPRFLQIFLLMNFNMGWFKKCRSKQSAVSVLNYNSLLKLNEFTSYFPDAELYKEKFLFLSKSFIAKGS